LTPAAREASSPPPTISTIFASVDSVDEGAASVPLSVASVSAGDRDAIGSSKTSAGDGPANSLSNYDWLTDEQRSKILQREALEKDQELEKSTTLLGSSSSLLKKVVQGVSISSIITSKSAAGASPHSSTSDLSEKDAIEVDQPNHQSSR